MNKSDAKVLLSTVLGVLLGYILLGFPLAIVLGGLGLNFSWVTGIVGLGGAIGGGVLGYRIATNKPTDQEELACAECHLSAPHHLDNCSLA